MFKLLFTLSALSSFFIVVFGIPVKLEDSDEQNENFNTTDVENINQVAFSPSQIYAGNKEYKIVAFFRVNWFAAQQLCSSYGLNLASINSPAESAKMQQYIIDNGLFGETFWTSGNTLSQQNRWFWMSNGNAFVYTNWEQNEPNNVEGNEECLEVYPNGRWNDNNCYSNHYFICENRCPLTSYDVPLYPQGYEYK